MEILEAENVLKKYGLKEMAHEEFKRRTRNDTGKMNVGLRLRICADYLDKKARELQEERRQILKDKNHVCPNYEYIKKQKNVFAHNDCKFNCMEPYNFCLKCEFYISNIKVYDEAVLEVSNASTVYRKEADYDDTWQ